MIFAAEYKLGQCPDLTVKINGSKIKPVDRKDYLGLTLDEKLKWDKQVHEMCKKVSSAISGIKLARFLPLNALKKLYDSLGARSKFFGGGGVRVGGQGWGDNSI